jgi:hypothetical protein
VNGPGTNDPELSQVRELAAECVKYVSQATGVTLDNTPDTLPLLDHYLRNVPGESSTDVRALVAAAAGAYFGEVVRAQFPCRWHAPRDDFGAWRIEFDDVFLHFNPVAFAHEAVMGTEVVAGGSGFGVLDKDLDLVRAGLAALGTIAEEDYFKLSTRFEVLTTVVDRLVAQKEADGESATYDAEAYRAALDSDVGDKPS